MHLASQKPLPLLLIVSLATLLTVVLAACGSNGASGSGAGSGSTPTPITVLGYGTAHGCPGDALVSTAAPAANVTVKLVEANTTVKAHVGDIIEIQLPFGQKWTGPTASVGILQLQTPAGYASAATKMCIWRFRAQGAGMALLPFSASALCKVLEA
jgi:hypothetical protein